MIKKIISVSFVAFLFSLTQIQANEFKNLQHFMPENNLHLEDTFSSESGITEEEFNAVIDKAIKAYSSIIKDHGGTLLFNKYWSSNTVNASAYRTYNDEWVVNMYGGLARRPEITLEGFTLVVCHELGHHLGGFPYYVQHWAANEGQADYYATLACGKYLWQNDKLENETFKTSVDENAKFLCDEKWNKLEDKYLCYRQMMGSLSITTLLAALGNDGEISINTPDITVVNDTYHKHPEAQCRLDTYVAGVLCDANWDITIVPLDEEETKMYSCIRSEGYTVEARPLCWYKPTL